MATYKVIQDIEAEDKLVGPLTLKQFIFAAIAGAFIFIAFMVATKINIFAAIPFLPFILVPGILAAPLGGEQPTDTWLAAQLRFFLKPKKRLWDQSGIKQLVTITAPKKENIQYSNGLSQQEVKSRLKALADTIDTRGWAIKNVDVNLYSTPNYNQANDSDRLIGLSSLPQTVPDVDVTASDDIMDNVNNPVAQHFDQMIKSANNEVKDTAIQKMQKAIKSPSQIKPTVTNTTTSTKVNISKQDEQKLLKHAKQEHQREQMIHPHHKEILTPEEVKAQEKPKQKQQINPDIINLANANDLNVASIAHLANRKGQDNQEVVIKLH